LAFGLFRAKQTTPRLERLRALSLFVDLSPAELSIVDGLLHERDYLAGEVIFDQGEEGHAMYIIIEGDVLICRQGQPEEGLIARLCTGAFFGDLALLDNQPRSAQARAATPCKMAVFFREDFFGLLETHARIASKILPQLARHIGRRLREVASDRAAQHL
jgi:CRP-like cAMP-binding protein